MPLASVDFNAINRPRMIRKTLLENFSCILPVGLTLVVGILRNSDVAIEIRLIKGGVVLRIGEIPGIPHLRHVDLHPRFLCTLFQVPGPVVAPERRFVGLITDAVENVRVLQTDGEEGVYDSLLIVEKLRVGFKIRWCTENWVLRSEERRVGEEW